MVRRKQRFEMPPRPAAVVRALRALRETLISEVDREVVPFNPIYVLSEAIIRAIDAMAERLTGERDYFQAKGHGGAYHADIEEKRAARERGDIPWER